MDNSIIDMAKLEFPSTVTWTQRYFTGGDVSPDLSYTNLSYFYEGARNYIFSVDFDTSNVTNMSYMFVRCKMATYVDLFDTSKVTTMSNMFYDCSVLCNVPLFDTSKVTDMSRMFYGCSQLSSVPLFDTSSVTTMSNMFYNCSKLQTIPEFDFSNVTNLESMFGYCEYLHELPNINCKKATQFSSWLNNATHLVKVGIIDCDSITNAQYILTYNTNSRLRDVGGFRNLGAKSSVSNTNSNYFIYNTPNLTRQSLLNIFNLLYDRATAGYSVLTIKLHPMQRAKLTDEDIAIATNKGWALS